jgi:hypothetical protein
MARRRSKITHHRGFSPGLILFSEIENINIAAWCPDDKAELPPHPSASDLKHQGFSLPMHAAVQEP